MKKQNTVVAEAVNVSGMIAMLPESVRFRNLKSIDGTAYAAWWWHNIRSVRMCAEHIISNQGGVSTKNQKGQFFNPSSFRTRDETGFAWISATPDAHDPRESSMGTLTIGSIDDCVFRPMPKQEIYVPCGWSTAVLKMVDDYGIVSIQPFESGEPRIGIRWNGEHVLLNGIKLGWRG